MSDTDEDSENDNEANVPDLAADSSTGYGKQLWLWPNYIITFDKNYT